MIYNKQIKVKGRIMANLNTVNEVSELFAANAHEQWRKIFDEDYAKKSLKSKRRIKENSSGVREDIHVEFKNLHEDWKKENFCAGVSALMAILNNSDLMRGDVLAMERAAEDVHLAWMNRNKKSEFNATEHVSYKELSEEQKQKDREQIKQMICVLKDFKNILTAEDLRSFLEPD